jgi:hypothetical protein
LVILDFVETGPFATFQRPCNQGVRVIAKNFHPGGSRFQAWVGLSHSFLAGSPRKKGAPAMSMPATGPKLHSSVAPHGTLIQSDGLWSMGTASITDMTGPRVFDFTTVSFFRVFLG